MLPRPLALLTWFLAAGTPLPAQTPAYWPQFGGPDRNHVSRETGLLREWPKEGPQLAWKVTNLGSGLAPVSIAEGRIYTLAFREGKEYAVALDRGTGKEIWAKVIGQAREGPGMRHLCQRQPVIDRDRLYVFSGEGKLFCLDADSSQTLWKKDYVKDFGGKVTLYRWFNENPLVDGDRLMCTPGGHVLALNKFTGKTVWKTRIPDASAPLCPPLIAPVDWVRQCILLGAGDLIGLDVKDGKRLWTTATPAHGIKVTTPIVYRDRIFVAGGINGGGALLKLVPGESMKAEVVYDNARFGMTVHGGMVLVGDHIYGANGAHSAGAGRLTCVDLKSGKTVWEQPAPRDPAWSMLAAEGRLYCRSPRGTVTLVEAAPEGYRERGRFLPTERSKEPAWTVPVLAGGKLYLRDQDILLCYDVRANRTSREKTELKKPDKESSLPDAIFVPSPQDVVEKMLELAKVTKEDVVVDLGCGDGRIPVTAAKKYGCVAIGYDIDEECVNLSNARVKENKVDEQVCILRENVFQVDLSHVGDLIRGKHGGMVVLACGNPGVGKTLTAEVYAEKTRRPLYVLELGELGTRVDQVEANLHRVFARVARWNAVLQFDECEIFLAQRGEDLERSAIVGSFLRLLDYYQGILFLTTNRWNVLDHAVLSRVMLKLDYPDLDRASRTVIWKTMLQAAGLTLVNGSVEELAEADINGRQIRNLTRLAGILHPQRRVNLDQMHAVLGYGCRSGGA